MLTSFLHLGAITFNINGYFVNKFFIILTMSTKPTIIPWAIFDLFLWINMKEWAFFIAT